MIKLLPHPISAFGADDMHPVATSIFTLPDHLAAKADPQLIARDEQHLRAVATALQDYISELTARLDAARKAPGGAGQAALDRDQDIHRLTGRLRVLRRFSSDLCLGRMVTGDGDADGAAEPTYIGRLGLTDRHGQRLLVDWRAPAAEPFFAATHANPMGLISRRRYRWTRGHITDFWDEVFTPEGLEGNAALDDQSAFIASLGGSRSEAMRDVLGTIQADQDAIIRAGSRGALVVDGGPGTGKTVVALHRTAHLLYSDTQVSEHRGGVLFVGPHRPYLAYVADVLPNLGEDSVRTCTLNDLLPEGLAAAEEADPEVARLKFSAEMVNAIGPAVALYEKPPTEGMEIDTPWGEVWLSSFDWAEAFSAPDPGTPHNEARGLIWESVVEILTDKVRDLGEDASDVGVDLNEDVDGEFNAYGLTREDSAAPFRRAISQNPELKRTFGRAWPLLHATDLVGDLWEVPAYLRMCAPWLEPRQIQLLRRADPRAWTTADLPLLDAARQRLGDPDTTLRAERRRAAEEAESTRMADVVDQLIESDDSDMRVMRMLRGQDLQQALVEHAAPAEINQDALAGPFAHIVVDEAQELTEAQWQMLLRRCPSRSFTIVGDRAQARHGFTETWEQRLERVGFDRVTHSTLTINYRTPREVMVEAEPVIRAAIPDANVPISVRSSGVPVKHGVAADLEEILDQWEVGHDDGVACVIGAPHFTPRDRVQSLLPALAKGLEFDLVVLLDPERSGGGVAEAVDRYVAMTRTTQELVLLERP